MSYSNSNQADRLSSRWTVVDVGLDDLRVSDEELDVTETITVTFAVGDAAKALGLEPKGMLPTQATDLAMALIDSTQAWGSGGPLEALAVTSPQEGQYV